MISMYIYMLKGLGAYFFGLEHMICKKTKEMFFLVSGAFVYHVKATINHRATWDPKIGRSAV